MNQAAGEGGGGVATVGAVVVDPDRLRRVTSKLTAAGTTLDGCADSMPATGATGDAEMLISAILAEFSETAVDLISEGELLAQTADSCNVAYVDADAEAAARFLVEGVENE
ncbi:hypothetical protein [Aeromicrobium stalagmiti]|uniref:hypothetical protein n=1 Tax=Aeromicrobium stalagmiti TaxID=2738988 RepID=UPI0015689577|nr:hypothetical protein [Aeromicrobium stalagmiti]NRQ49487.1 hypothetical protein [Aeromicrobium stalagmiti]